MLNTLLGSLTLESTAVSEAHGKVMYGHDDAEMLEVDKEIEEATAEANEADKELADLDNAVATLESVAMTLESDIAEGGLSAQAAKYLSLTMESVMGGDMRIIRDGKVWSTPKVPVMSLESFGGTYTQEEASTMTLEGIRDTLKSAYQSVRNAAARSANAAREFTSRLFRGTKGLKKTIAKQREAVTTMNEGDREQIKIGGFAARLHVGGSVDVRTVTDAVKNVSDAGEDLLKGYLDAAVKFYNDLASGMGDLARARKEMADVDKMVNDAVEAAGDELESLVKKYSSELPGGYELVYSVDEGESKSKDSAGYSLSALTVEKKEKGSTRFNTGQKVDAGSKKDMEDILSAVEKMIDTIDGRKARIEELATAREAALKAGDDMIKDVAVDGDDKGAAKAAKNDAKSLKKLLRAANKNASRSITNYTGYSWKVCRAALMYVNANLSAKGAKPVAVEGGEGGDD